MMIDITNIRLDEVSVIMSKMDKYGFASRIEKKDDKYLLVLNQRPKPSVKMPTLLDW